MPKRVEYRYVPGYVCKVGRHGPSPVYRVGSDGSVWSCYLPGGRAIRPGTWHRVHPTRDGRVWLHLHTARRSRAVHLLVRQLFGTPPQRKR
jgi:hypothetical protein